MKVFKHKLLVFRCISSAFSFVAGMPTYGLAVIYNRSPEPGSESIKLNNAGVVADFKFEVRKHFLYWYSINFSFPENDQPERARIRKLLGGNEIDKTGKPLEPGIPTPINLTIFTVCKDGREIEIYSKDADPILTSWGGGSFRKNISSHVLTTGVYRARIINKRASPEFSSIPITFEIGMPAKVSFDLSNQSARREPCQR